MFVMMKRFFMLLAICLMLMPTALVYADAIIEPQNDFFFRHRSDCVYVDHSFYANGEDGYVSLKKEPGSKEEVAAIQNDEIVYVSHVYDYNGETWGVAEISTPEIRWVYGWVPLNQLLLIYDYRSFAEDHQDEFRPYAGDYKELLTAKQIVYWKYPGSGIVIGIMQENIEEFIGNFINSMDIGKILEPYISYVYTDEKGRDWGFSGWGSREGKRLWICLSDPENSDIPADGVWAADQNNSPKTGLSMIWVAVILVAALVIGTGILIRILWKPNKAG